MSKYKFPDLEGPEIPSLRADMLCEVYENWCGVYCSTCIFNQYDWTPEREAAFLEWESNQKKEEDNE